MGDQGLPPVLLVVDGSDSIRGLLMVQLGEHFRVFGASTGAAALATVVRNPPDVILIDHDLPDMSGLEVLRLLRADEALAWTPIITTTDAADRDLLSEALHAGAHDHVQKPFDQAELEARLTAAVRVKHEHDALVETNAGLTRQALTDELTGLANRRQGVESLERSVSLGVRHGHAFALARIDVDRFKEVNDSFGHHAGDLVLTEVARRLADAVRGGDELARWGGDEFVAILPETEREGAAHAAERMRAAVAASPVKANGNEVTVTVSVGWAHWAGDTASDLLARADQALYRAKDDGRDVVRPVIT